MKRCYFTCQDCGYTFDSMCEGDPNGTYEPCPKCQSCIGSYRRRDVEKAKNKTVVVKPQKAVHPTTYAAFCRWLENKKSHTL